MGWFEDIPKLFMTIILLIGLFSLGIFFLTTDLFNIDEAPDKITGLITEHAVPTEITWLAKVGDTISNPYLLLFSVIIILWLFGHFNKN